jgi:hypothetical protein
MKAKKDQYRRFLKAARELGVDESGAEFETAFAKAVPPKIADRRAYPSRQSKVKGTKTRHPKS